jgi:hypothetical protein
MMTVLGCLETGGAETCHGAGLHRAWQARPSFPTIRVPHRRTGKGGP